MLCRYPRRCHLLINEIVCIRVTILKRGIQVPFSLHGSGRHRYHDVGSPKQCHCSILNLGVHLALRNICTYRELWYACLCLYGDRWQAISWSRCLRGNTLLYKFMKRRSIILPCTNWHLWMVYIQFTAMHYIIHIQSKIRGIHGYHTVHILYKSSRELKHKFL